MLVNELHQGGIRALLDYDNTLFDNMVLPAGISSDDIIDNILFKYGDAPLFCPDPDVMKFYITKWSKKRLDQWNRYKEAIELKYDPISNYDRHEEGTDTNELKISADNATDYQPDSKAVRTPMLHTYGNIGVTTSQQMLQSEIDLIPKLNVIDFITEDFHSEFCLMVY